MARSGAAQPRGGAADVHQRQRCGPATWCSRGSGRKGPRHHLGLAVAGKGMAGVEARGDTDGSKLEAARAPTTPRRWSAPGHC
jgi:hypothetical protein